MTVVLIYEDVFGDDFGEEGFYIFQNHDHLFALPTFMWAIFFFGKEPKANFPIK